MKLSKAPADFRTKKPLYKPYKSDKKGKTGMVYTKKGLIHFGDSKMGQHPNDPKRKASYCARSSGIKGKESKDSANYWSRRMWKC